MRWPTLLIAASLAVAGAGCYASHERTGTPSIRDAAAPDGESRPDVPVVRPDAPSPSDAGSCTSGRGVVVRIEPITEDRARCDRAHAEAIAVYAVEPAPLVDGIRVRADLCPDADADCRCDYVLENVGSDLADLVLVPTTGLILDVGPSAFSLTQMPFCECLGCPCGMALVLQAADSFVDFPGPVPTDELDLGRGAEICAATGCEAGGWLLHASSIGGASDVTEGSDVELGIVHVRSIRNVDIFGPCAACAMCGSLQASWAAWIRH